MSVIMEIPKEQVRPLLTPLLSQVGFDPESDFEVRPIQARLWLSNAFKVVISTENGKKLSLFIKSLPGDMLRKEVFDAPSFFKNEVAFYKSVLPGFKKFQESRVEPEVEFAAVPRCYYALSDGVRDAIVLQDVQADGYEMMDRREILDVPHLHLVMRELGRLHAVSFAMKDQEPEEFNKLKAALEETVWNDRFVNKMGSRMFTETCTDAIRLAKETYSDDCHYVTALQRLLNNIEKVMRHQVTPEEPLSVITHGDFWVNNFMFQHSEPGVLEKMLFLDFQQSRYGSPALDVGSALYMNMDQATREAHRDALLSSYHDSLSELMRALGSDIDKIFPFEKLEEELMKYSVYGIVNAFMNIPQALDVHEGGVEEMENLGKLGEGQFSIEQIVDFIIGELEKPYHRKTDKCKKRVSEVIKEAVDRGYLDNLSI